MFFKYEKNKNIIIIKKNIRSMFYLCNSKKIDEITVLLWPMLISMTIKKFCQSHVKNDVSTFLKLF